MAPLPPLPLGARVHRAPVIGRAAANDGAQPRLEGAPVTGMPITREVFDHAEQDFLAEVLQIVRRHALAIEPTDDQRTIQGREVLPGISFTGLGRAAAATDFDGSRS